MVPPTPGRAAEPDTMGEAGPGREPEAWPDPRWLKADDDERLAILQAREDLLWLCEGRGDGDHAQLVRGWSAIIRHYASLAINYDVDGAVIAEAAALFGHADCWDFGQQGTAGLHFVFEDGGLSYTLVTDFSALAPPAQPAAPPAPDGAYTLADLDKLIEPSKAFLGPGQDDTPAPATLSAQQGGAVPAKDLLVKAASRIAPLLHETSKRYVKVPRGWVLALSEAARLAEQPALAGTGADPATLYARRVTIPYTNWRDDFGRREIAPIRLIWGSNEWHPTPQWLIEAWDIGKSEIRTFALSGIGGTGADGVEGLRVAVVPSRAAQDVFEERQRQIEAEGWTPRHDDEHDKGEMAHAAAAYIRWGAGSRVHHGTAPADWPWSSNWWKPTNRRRDLVKAGALILAEIERLDRRTALDAGSSKEGR